MRRSPDCKGINLPLSCESRLSIHQLHEEMAGTGDGSSITQRRKSIKRSSRRGKVHSRQYIVVATWNVCTLVEDAGGDRRICRSRPQSRVDRRNSPQKPGPHLVNRKLDFLARDLKRYGVSIAAIQETKWYGNDVWQAN